MLHRFSAYFLTATLLAASTLALAGEAGRLVFAAGSVQVSGQPASTNHVVMEGDSIVTMAAAFHQNQGELLAGARVAIMGQSPQPDCPEKV